MLRPAGIVRYHTLVPSSIPYIHSARVTYVLYTILTRRLLSIRLKSFARQHSSSAVCGPDRLESSSKFREISVCVTTYNRKAIWLHISLRSCFSGHFMSVSRAVTISPLVSIFAKDGRRYICARLLSIEAIDCQISCFASDHRKLALSSHGTDLLYLYQLVPH